MKVGMIIESTMSHCANYRISSKIPAKLVSATCLLHNTGIIKEEQQLICCQRINTIGWGKNVLTCLNVVIKVVCLFLLIVNHYNL